MEGKDNLRGYDLEKRLERFALRVLRLVRSLPRTKENLVYGGQVLRSSSSMGANYAEATCATSKRDFTNDLNRVRKEAKESFFWLRLLSQANPEFGDRMKPLVNESEELFMIFNRAVKTSKDSLKAKTHGVPSRS